MTENEAKEKWCPFGVSFDGGNTTRSHMDGKALPRCIASACMAWRWAVRPVAARPASERVVHRNTSTGTIFIWETIPEIEAVEGDGYCGLAGSA